MAAAASEARGEAQAAGSLSLADIQHPFTIGERVVIDKLLKSGTAFVGQTVVAGGWVKTGRTADKGAFAFLEVNDGSCPANLQVIVSADVFDLSILTSTGASVLVKGVLVESPKDKKQAIELKATEVLFAGSSEGKTYPIAKTRDALSLEFLRSVIHFRVRTQTIAAITRIRNTLAAATHEFFQKNGFLYVHSPVVTASDCEGAGEMFQLTTLLSEADKLLKAPITPAEIERLQAEVSAQGSAVKELKTAKVDKPTLQPALDELERRKVTLKNTQDLMSRVGGLPHTAEGSIDYTKDFFGKPAFLTVSGQLEAEIYACALTSVYTFGPTFRAEKSHTTRHLAEFWMIEPEIAFCDLEGNMKCAEQYVRYCCQAVLDRSLEDLQFLASRGDKGAVDRVKQVATSAFARVSYTEAIELLQQHIKEGKKEFKEMNVVWGIDLQSEHERYLAEEVYKCPLIVYNYPKEIKSFYMRLNEDGKTVAAMDVLVPGVGELIGGSQREERADELEKRIESAGLNKETYSWYLDLRRYGTVPHSGFGLGFERLIMFTTGIENIRDVIPFPRYPGHIL
eukprot:m.221164 g.221164  ORF g.221164 m.221164 type:complete len:567 (-) comp15733_c0_seq1:36-1736(-)